MLSINATAPDGWDATESGNWTDRLNRLGAAAGLNRQCSIGFHEECSDPEGDDCACHCHPWSAPPPDDTDAVERAKSRLRNWFEFMVSNPQQSAEEVETNLATAVRIVEAELGVYEKGKPE